MLQIQNIVDGLVGKKYGYKKTKQKRRYLNILQAVAA